VEESWTQTSSSCSQKQGSVGQKIPLDSLSSPNPFQQLTDWLRSHKHVALLCCEHWCEYAPVRYYMCRLTWIAALQMQGKKMLQVKFEGLVGL
jgi:hypothetical protein